MPITATQQQDLLKLGVGMFNASLGGYMVDLVSVIAPATGTGPTMAQLYETLANSTTFTGLNFAYSNAATNAQFATYFAKQILGTSVSTANLTATATYLEKLLDAGQSRGAVIKLAVDFLASAAALTDAVYGPAAQQFVNKVTVATDYTITKSGTATDVSTLQTSIASVTSSAASVASAIGGGVTTGKTYTLTTGTDTVAGTGDNDLIIANNTTSSKFLNSTDQIDLGAGIDTVKVYLATTDTALGLPTLTNVEIFYINGGAITALTAPAGVTTLSIDAPVANTPATYTIANQAVILAKHTVTADTTTTIASATDTTQNITVNGQSRTGTAVNTLDLSGSKVATLNLTTAGADSTISLNNTGAALTTLNIAGDKNLALTERTAAVAGTVTTIDATAATGNVSVNATAASTAAGFKYKGGSGTDTLTFANDEFGALTAGSQLDGGAGTSDKIGLLDTDLTAAEAAKINATVGFEVLGLNTGITLDASTLTSIKKFSVDTAAQTLTIGSMATGSLVTVTTNTTKLTLGAKTGVTDTSIALGLAASAGITVATLDTTGITKIALSSNGTAANTLTAMTNSDDSTFTVTGTDDLTMTLNVGTAFGSKVDASAFTGKLTVTGSNIIASGDTIIGGSGADTISGRSGADTLTGGAGADTFSFANVNAGGTNFGQGDVITDFVVGTDKLQFAGITDVVSAQQDLVQAVVSALPAGSNATAIANEMAAANDTAAGVCFAVFQGDTYVLMEQFSGASGSATNDVFIKLVGVAVAPTFAADVVA